MRRIARTFSLGLLIFAGCGSPPGPDHPDPGSRLAPVQLIAEADLPLAEKPVAPIRLTASDGSGLTLVELSARAVVDDPLAFTELRLVFENPEPRTREGTFSIVLPQGAAISRFAMKVGSALQEGEVVERQQARQAYEDFLHRKQDPALLEQNAGNEFSARVFPIPAKGKKEIIVSYSQEITAATPYVLPLVGLPQIASLDIDIFAAGHAAPLKKISRKDMVPTADIRLDGPPSGDRAGLRSGNLVVTRVKPVVTSRPEPLQSAAILIDTSASRALGQKEQIDAARRIAAAVLRASAGKGPIVVAAYDQSVDPIYEGPAAGFGEEALERLRKRMALGASNLDLALGWVGERARALGVNRVVLITDGIPTVGAVSGDKLRARVTALGASGVERLDAIATGGIRDDDLLRSLANAGLAKVGTVMDGKVPEEEMARRLSEATLNGVEVKVEGAEFVFPTKLDAVQAGDEALVYATVPENKPIRVSVGGGPWEPRELVRTEKPLLERAWVGAKIKSLLEMERTKGSSVELSEEITNLSTQYRVLSPKTALLVLETDWDYQRFGIDRTALADVLIADGGHVSLLRRSLPAPVKAPPQPAPPNDARVVTSKPAANKATGAADGSPPGAAGSSLRNDAESARGNMWGAEIGDSFGAGGLGLTGIGEGGGGRSEGIGLGSIGTLGHGAGTGPGAIVTRQESRTAVDPGPPPMASAAPRAEMESRRSAASGAAVAEGDVIPKTDPYTGPFKTVMGLIAEGRMKEAEQTALAWHSRDPGDVLALIALGEVYEKMGDPGQAARCYGSLIDLFPSRADMRRFAGERLERLAVAGALDLASDTFAKAKQQRPDHPASHRLYAFSLVRKGQYEKAYDALLLGLSRGYPEGRFRGVQRILAEDLGLIGAAWAKAEPQRKDEIRKRVRKEGGLIEDQPSIRFVLNWETDANDVDFHIYDGKGGHAFYGRPTLGTGGELYADVTTGYGPECFTIRLKPEERSGPYVLQANYYSRGPMGYGMGKVEIIEHDGKGDLRFEERPFIVMTDRAFVDLGTVKR